MCGRIQNILPCISVRSCLHFTETVLYSFYKIEKTKVQNNGTEPYSDFLLCSGETVTIQKEWTLDSNVRILHSTAIGNLYRFDGTENSISLRPSGYCGKNDNCINCRYSTQKVDGGTLEISLTPKERKRKKRYLTIDFKVRAYPALSKVKSPDFEQV